MISWIQNHLIRHGRWIFLTLLAVIIVAFVFTIGNTPGFAPRMDGWEPDEFYGVNLNAPLEARPLRERVFYSQLLSTGRQPMSEQQIEEGLRVRIALLHLADRLGLPGPTERELSAFVRTRPAFFDAEGNFSRDRYLSFVDDLEADPSSSPDILFRVLEEDFRIDRVARRLGGPGFFLPAEAVAVAQREQTQFELKVASLAIDAFQPEIVVEEESLNSFFNLNAERYREPERIRASLVRFPNDPATIELDASEVEAHYNANRERFHSAHLAANPPAENEETAAEEVAIDFATVRERVENELKEQRARRLSNERAHAFAFTLYDRGINRDASGFQQLLENEGLTPVEIEPFSVDEVGQRGLPRQLLESAFTLTRNRFYTGAVEINGDFGVLIFDGRIDSYVPELQAVREHVEADYREQERRRRFAEKGSNVRQALLAAIANKTDVAEAAENEGWTVETFGPFLYAEAPRELGRNVLEMLPTLSAGEVSPMLTSENRGRLVYVTAKEVPEKDADTSEVAEAAEMLKRYSSFASTRSLLEELLDQGQKQN
jgi:peptidyl-prolyl cis-trans isomerase D